MRLYTRIIFGFNCLYQIVIGAIFLAAPVLSIALFGFPAAEGQSLAAHVCVRLMGVFLLVAGVISALIAANPDKNPVLLPIMGLVSALTLLCWGTTVVAHEMTMLQVAFDAAVQLLLLIAIAGYAGKAGKTVGQSKPAHA